MQRFSVVEVQVTAFILNTRGGTILGFNPTKCCTSIGSVPYLRRVCGEVGPMQIQYPYVARKRKKTDSRMRGRQWTAACSMRTAQLHSNSKRLQGKPIERSLDNLDVFQ
jgi:hypothetical protein